MGAEEVQFIQDASHYDELITQRAGLAGYTHKLTDGNHFYRDPEYQAAMNNARQLSIPVLGSYHVLWPATPAAQVDWWVSEADALTPWWRSDCDCFVWQLDCEPFNYLPRAPNKAEIEQATDRLLYHRIELDSIGGYCPEWVYHDTLTGMRPWIWASNYGSNPRGDYREVYPGNSSPRWHRYSGKDPLGLQYGSETTIGNQTTCDASAFRFATVADLIKTLGGRPMSGLTDDQMQDLYRRVCNLDAWAYYGDAQGLAQIPANTLRLGFGAGKLVTTPTAYAVTASQAAQTSKLAEIENAIKGLALSGGASAAEIEAACRRALTGLRVELSGSAQPDPPAPEQ